MQNVKLHTTRDLIRDVAARWAKQYQRATGWGIVYSGNEEHSSHIIYERLRALDTEKATVADVTAIIGNGTWTEIMCGVCHATVEMAVELGDSDAESVKVCERCLRSAMMVLHEERAR